ncbi:MAG: substrate-binding domain-containing protein [Rubrivivax sp.]|nr:substrate-binding domain-containing protein [Rubrivivax sp.]
MGSSAASPAPPIVGVSSMATKAVLAELIADYQRQSGARVAMESVGGVDAARRVQDGEPFDLVVLASDAIDRLAAAGHLQAGSRVDLVRSPVAMAVRSGSPRPELGDETAVRQAVLAAPSVGYSTGPSGTHLSRLFERWGIADQIKARLVQPPPGVAVGRLVAGGEVALGFQQLSELIHLPGVDVLGTLPPAIEFITTFSGAVGARSTQPTAARELLSFMAAPAADAAKQRHGMAPARDLSDAGGPA